MLELLKGGGCRQRKAVKLSSAKGMTRCTTSAPHCMSGLWAAHYCKELGWYPLRAHGRRNFFSSVLAVLQRATTLFRETNKERKRQRLNMMTEHKKRGRNKGGKEGRHRHGVKGSVEHVGIDMGTMSRMRVELARPMYCVQMNDHRQSQKFFSGDVRGGLTKYNENR